MGVHLKSVATFQKLPDELRGALRNEAYLPLIRRHPCFDLWARIEPAATFQIRNKAVAEVRLLPTEELFSCIKVVTKMVFVIVGTITYCPKDYSDMTHDVRAGEWACEEAIWAVHAYIAGPFVAMRNCSEVLLLSCQEVQDIGRMFPASIGFLGKYADTFINTYNEAIKDHSITNPLFNDFNIIEELVTVACRQLSGLQRSYTDEM